MRFHTGTKGKQLPSQSHITRMLMGAERCYASVMRSYVFIAACNMRHL